MFKLIKERRKYIILTVDICFTIFCLCVLPYTISRLNQNLVFGIKIFVSLVCIVFTIIQSIAWHKYNLTYGKKETYKLGNLVFRFFLRIILWMNFIRGGAGLQVIFIEFHLDLYAITDLLILINSIFLILGIGADVINMSFGTSWNTLALVVLSLSPIILPDDKFISALIILGVLKLSDWLSSSDSLYYFINPDIKLETFDIDKVPFEVKRRWMIQKANNLFISMSVALTYAARETISKDSRDRIVNDLVSFLYNINFLKGDRNLSYNRLFAESVIILVVFIIIFAGIKSIIIKGKCKIPYISRVIDYQKSVAKEIEINKRIKEN